MGSIYIGCVDGLAIFIPKTNEDRITCKGFTHSLGSSRCCKMLAGNGVQCQQARQVERWKQGHGRPCKQLIDQLIVGVPALRHHSRLATISPCMTRSAAPFRGVFYTACILLRFQHL